MLTSFPSARMAFWPNRDGSGELELVVRSVIEGVHSRLTQSPEGGVVGSLTPNRRESRGRRPKAPPARETKKPGTRRKTAKPAGLS
jgi:hypothetical protein